MKYVSKALHTMLCKQKDWVSVMSSVLEALKERMGEASCADKAFECAQCLEHCAVDRSEAIAGYVLCFRADSGRLDALVRARAIAVEVGDFSTAAKLARLQYKSEKNPELLLAAGNAWLDAGEPDLAIKPLSAAARKLPQSESVASALRTARREWHDVRSEVEKLKDRARAAQDPSEAADCLVQAARILRMLGSEPQLLENFLLAALKQDFENAIALGLLERQLSHLSAPDALMEVYERRIKARVDVGPKVEELRRAGMRLMERPQHRALGIRLVKQALQVAYKGGLVEIPGHLALLGILRDYCEEIGSLNHYLQFIDLALAQELPELDMLYLSLQGLEVAWRWMGDEASARTYGLIASRLAPGHPLVCEAREQALVEDGALATDRGGEPELSMAGLNEPAPGVEVGEMAFLDELGLAAPPHLIGNQQSLSEQFAALGVASQPAVEPLELVDPRGVAESLELVEPDVAESLELVEPDVAAEPLELVETDDTADDLEFIELDDEDMLEIEPESDAPFDTLPAEAGQGEGGPDKAAQDEGQGAAKAPGAPIGLGALIPRSALAALEHASSQRNKRPEAAANAAPRVTIPLAVDFLHEGETQSALTRDLSATGAFLATPVELQVGMELALTLAMPLDIGSLRSEPISLRARIVRSSSSGYGLAFVEPPESFKKRLATLTAHS